MNSLTFPLVKAIQYKRESTRMITFFFVYLEQSKDCKYHFTHLLLCQVFKILWAGYLILI